MVNYASSCAMELNLDKEITCERQNQSFLFNKYTSKALHQTLQTKKVNLEKCVGLTSFKKPTTAIRFNLLEVYPSVAAFVFVVSFIPSFNVFSSYFYDSLSLVAVPIVRILIKFVTQLL